MHKALVTKLAALTFAALLLGACGGKDNGTSGSGGAYGDNGGAYGDSAKSTAPAPAPASGAQLKVADSSLGKILTDDKGRTLYAFTKDTKGGPSTCYGECATAWPAAKADTTLSGGSGMTGKLGTSTRKDGTKQLTLNGWNLYYFAKDEGKAGWTKGQGVKDVWFVVDGSGKLVKSAQGSLPFTGPSDWLLPIGGTIVAAGLVMLVVTKRRGGLHTARPRH